MKRRDTKQAFIKFGLFGNLLALGCLAGTANATNYYVDKNSVGGTCSDDNPGTLTRPWRTIAKANTEACAGDTVCLRAGTYDNEQIKPAQSGTPGRLVLYRNYADEEVVITGGAKQIEINEKKYIGIHGINFRRPKIYWAEILRSDHIYVEGCVFDHVNPNVAKMSYRPYRVKGCKQIYHDHCEWTMEDQTSDHDRYMVVLENTTNSKFDHCRFGNAVHASFVTMYPMPYKESPEAWDRDAFLVMKNSMFYSEWHSQLAMGNGTTRDIHWLAENNTLFNSGKSSHKRPLRPPSNTNNALYVGGVGGIIRKNILYDNTMSVMARPNMLKNGADVPLNAWFYHNTFYNAKRNPENPRGKLDCSFFYSESGSAKHPDLQILQTTHILNNIFWKSMGDCVNRDFYAVNVYGGRMPYDNIIKNNLFGDPDKAIRGLWAGNVADVSWLEKNDPQWVAGTNVIGQDPLFRNTDKHDFRLQDGSPAIDRGSFLTTISSPTAAKQTRITLADATPFYSGAGAPWFIEGDVGDTIKTEHGRISTIQTIDYKNNTLTVSPAIDIVQNEGLSLDYAGSAPDLGAHEYRGAKRP